MPDTQDFDMDQLLPLLMKQKQDSDLQGQHNAAAKFLGNAVAPGLTSYLTGSSPKQPNIPSDYVGKIPSKDSIPPGLVGAISDVAGWAIPEAKAALAAKAAAPKVSSSLAALFLSNPIFSAKGTIKHHILDDNINRIGQITVEPKGSDLWVRSISGPGGLGADDSLKNKLGTSEMRSLLKALKDEYPDAETVSGNRITGARDGPAVDPTSIVSGNVSVRIRPPFEQRQQEEVDRLMNDPKMQEIVRRNMANIKL